MDGLTLLETAKAAGAIVEVDEAGKLQVYAPQRLKDLAKMILANADAVAAALAAKQEDEPEPDDQDDSDLDEADDDDSDSDSETEEYQGPAAQPTRPMTAYEMDLAEQYAKDVREGLVIPRDQDPLFAPWPADRKNFGYQLPPPPPPPTPEQEQERVQAILARSRARLAKLIQKQSEELLRE